MQGRLCIPYITPSGIVTLRFRSIPEDDGTERKPKYMSVPGDVPRLYNVSDLLIPSPIIAICEGEIDTMTVSSLCGVPAVGLQGVSTWRDIFVRVFSGYETVFIVADGDPVNEKSGLRPGAELAKTIMSDLEGAKPVWMPEGFDANSYVTTYGPQALTDEMGLQWST